MNSILIACSSHKIEHNEAHNILANPLLKYSAVIYRLFFSDKNIIVGKANKSKDHKLERNDTTESKIKGTSLMQKADRSYIRHNLEVQIHNT